MVKPEYLHKNVLMKSKNIRVKQVEQNKGNGIRSFKSMGV